MLQESENKHNSMRKIIFSFAMVFASIATYAQNWAPVGENIKSEWAEQVDPYMFCRNSSFNCLVVVQFLKSPCMSQMIEMHTEINI